MATIIALFRLQELELAIRKTAKELAGVAARIARDEASTRAAAESVRAKRVLAALQSEQSTLDAEVQTASERRTGLEQRLYSGVTAASKDLFSLQKEIAFLQNKQQGLEDRLLAVMEQAETAQSRADTLEVERAAIEADWRASLPGLNDEHSRLQQRAANAQRDRDEAEAALDAPSLRTYRSLESSRGSAVARVERGMCGGCVIAVPSHELQLVRSGPAPVRCPNCGRFLYAE